MGILIPSRMITPTSPFATGELRQPVNLSRIHGSEDRTSIYLNSFIGYTIHRPLSRVACNGGEGFYGAMINLIDLTLFQKYLAFYSRILLHELAYITAQQSSDRSSSSFASPMTRGPSFITVTVLSKHLTRNAWFAIAIDATQLILPELLREALESHFENSSPG